MSQPLFFIIGFFIYVYASWKQAKEKLYSERVIFDSVAMTSLGALVGARIFYILFHFNEFGFNILKWFLFGFFPGFSYAGGFMGAAFVLYILSGKKTLVSFQELVDVLTKSLFIAIPIALFGFTAVTPETGLPLPQTSNLLGLTISHHPVTFYRLIAVSFVLLIHFILKKRKIELLSGAYSAFSWSLVLASFFFIDFFKMHDVYYGKLAIDQWILSVLILMTVIIISFSIGQKSFIKRKI